MREWWSVLVDATHVAFSLQARRRYPVVGFATAIVVLSGVGAANYKNALLQAEATDWVAHTYLVTEALQDITAGMSQAESAVRGYAINRDPRVLEGLSEGAHTARGGLAAATKLTIDNARQQGVVDALAPLLQRRMLLLDELVRDADRGGPLVVPEEAILVSGEIRRTVHQAIDDEHRLMDDRRARADQATHRTVASTAAGLVVSLALLGAVFATLSREIRQRTLVERSLRSKHALIDSLFQSSSDALYVKDRDGRYLLINEAGARFSGHRPQDLIGKTDFERFPPELAGQIRAADQAVMASGITNTIENELTRDGETRVFESTKGPWRDPEQGILGIVGSTRDVTERRREDRARHSESSVLLQMGEMLQSCRNADEAYKVVEMYAPQLFPGDSGALSLFHSSRNALETRARWGDLHLEDASLHFAPDDCWAIRRGRPHHSVVGAGMPCRHLPADLPSAALCQPLVAHGELLGVLQLAAARDLDEETRRRVAVVGEQISLALANLQLRETLRNQSIRDPLTGLYNRRYAEETLRREVDRGRRTGAPLAVLAIDVDHFKRFNDSFGHDAGDLVLRELGGVLLRSTRASDVASRLGGEELLVLLPGSDLVAATGKAEKLRRAIAALDLRHHGKALGSITASIGVAVLNRHASDGETLLRAADEALYRAKREGRDRVVTAIDQAPTASLAPPPRKTPRPSVLPMPSIVPHV